jgi:alpha-amylase/alpha-mannosidase (GH57 family)
MADLAFLWHMHQPDYRHPETGEFLLPWVLLHAIKDYADMAGHLERHPDMRCTVNFVPVLLDQIEDYADQFATGRWRDPLLRVAAHEDPDRLEEADRRWLLDMAFRCHAPTMLEPFAPYRRLRDLWTFTRGHGGAGLEYLSGQYFADLATWYLLVWTGETLRRDCSAIPALMAKGDRFTLADRECLLATLGGVVRHLIPRYRALGDREQIELSCTPAGHPLAPLLIDFSSAREAWPDCPLPGAPEYPDGPAQVDIHLQEAGRSHEARFGRAPAGLWPAEGALSAPFLEQVGRAGFAWTASSFGVL